jgi:hypothetical protein
MPGGEGQIVFVTGDNPEDPMTFPVFNPTDFNLPDWNTKRRPPQPDPVPNAVLRPEGLPPGRERLQWRLERIHTRSRQFGVHNVIYAASLYPNEPTVRFRSVWGPGVPNLEIPPDGAAPHGAPVFPEGKGTLTLHLPITREDLL